MIKLQLTQGKFAYIDDCDAHLADYNWCFMKAKKTGYAIKALPAKDGKHKNVLLHHLIIGHPLNKMQVDHIDGDGLNNIRKNLRIVTNRRNSSNKKCHREDGKLVGAHFVKDKRYKYKKWKSEIKIGGKEIFLGYFKTEEEAANAYQKAAEKVSHPDTSLSIS